jgi:hypothetical protein
MSSQAVSSVRVAGVLASSTILFVACATLGHNLRVGSDYDRGANFAGYHSFALMHRDHHGSHNPLVAARTEDAIKEDLMRRGYQWLSDGHNADFVVDFTIGSHERTDIHSYPEPYVGPWWGSPWWGSAYWGNNVDVRQYREGTLSVDIFDGHSHRPVWHGWAKKELSDRDMEQSEGPIRHAVDAVLSQFPPR